MKPSLSEDALNLPAFFREQVRPLLPDRAFLRRDRVDGLFITNAPRFGDVAKIIDQIRMHGFICADLNDCLRISPGPQLLTDFELHYDAPDFFCESLLRLRGTAPCAEALTLFSKGIQLLENADPGKLGEYLKQTRRLAAFCLRTRQGGAYACALITHVLTERRTAI